MITREELVDTAEAILGRNVGSNPRHPWVHAFNTECGEPFSAVGKWITWVDSLPMWQQACERMGAGDLFWEMKISTTSNPNEGGHAICVYAPGHLKGEALAVLRELPLWQNQLLWKYDKATRDNRYGFGSYAFISPSGSRGYRRNDRASMAAFDTTDSSLH